MTSRTVWNSGQDFERDVIKIARMLWPNAGISGAIVIDGRERDGVFVTEEAIHIVECTLLRTKQKAVDDIDKSVKLGRAIKRQLPDKPIQCWFITADEPTAEQRTVAQSQRETRVNAVSYDSFRGRLIDAASYLNMRREYAFGSARNLRDGSAQINRNEYVGLDLLRISDSTALSVNQIVEQITSGRLRRVVLLGDFGAGKSMTLRELYMLAQEAYGKGQSVRFPVYINLRDHSGQQDPVEVIERHARKIGFNPPHHLVRAWRAGYVFLILDGFDELSSSGWLAFNKRLRNVRYATVEAVRKFVEETPSDAPVIIAGRISYFDNADECLRALGTSNETASVFSLNDFSEAQIASFLSKLGVKGKLPAWLPSRPLLIGVLAVRGALEFEGDSTGEVESGVGWDRLLSLVCEREARTHEAVDAETIRSIIEHLASVARGKGAISAPMTPADMAHAYFQVVGVEPDQRAEALLMRLPGLGYASGGEGERAFVDPDFAGAAAAGDVVRYVQNPFGLKDTPVTHVKEVLTESAVGVATHQILSRGLPHEKLYVAMTEAAKSGDTTSPEHGLAVDLIKVAASGLFEVPRETPRFVVRGVLIDELDLTETKNGLSEVSVKDCMVSTLYLPESRAMDSEMPHFLGVEIEHVEGRAGKDELLSGKFPDCSFGTFSAGLVTNAAVMDAHNLAAGPKALVVVLRKLFLQKGAGRKANSFYRGIGGASGITTAIVDRVLELVSSADFAQPSKRGGEPVWHPNRRLAARAKMIVANPNGSKEPIVVAAREIR